MNGPSLHLGFQETDDGRFQGVVHLVIEDEGIDTWHYSSTRFETADEAFESAVELGRLWGRIMEALGYNVSETYLN